MCRPVKCRDCGKTTWAGCGAHIDQVLGHLPEDEICRCREKKQAGSQSGAQDEQKKGFFGRFTSR